MLYITLNKLDHKMINREFLQAQMPKAPPMRIVRDFSCNYCKVCHSTKSRTGWFGLFGKFKCHQPECSTNK